MRLVSSLVTWDEDVVAVLRGDGEMTTFYFSIIIIVIIIKVS